MSSTCPITRLSGTPVPYLSSPWFGQSTSMQNLMLGSGNTSSGVPSLFQPGGGPLGRAQPALLVLIPPQRACRAGRRLPSATLSAMHRFVVLILLACAPLFAADSDALVKYFVAFLHKGPQFSALPAESPARKRNHDEHIAYIERMQAEGKMLLFGPILDAGDLRGMYVFRAASIDQARQWANEEPSVKIGMIEMRVYPWLGPARLGATPKPKR